MKKTVEYKKTWKPFYIMLIIYLLLLFSFPCIAYALNLNMLYITKLTLLLSDLWLFILMVIIYKGQYVYWLNGGPDYNEALKAGSKIRKIYAGKHLKYFSIFLLPFILYLLISMFFMLSIWIDITVFFIGVISTALSSTKIKFDNNEE